MSKTRNKFSAEIRERAVRIVTRRVIAFLKAERIEYELIIAALKHRAQKWIPILR